MKKILAVIFFLKLFISSALNSLDLVDSGVVSEVEHRIVFGSCYNPNKGDAIWNLIAQSKPNQLILLGDQVYGDFHPVYKYKRFNGSTPEQLEEEYVKFHALKGFQELSHSLSHGWIATYDDHDYGKDNGDKTFRYRQEAVELFRKYNPHFDPMIGAERKEGVFSSHSYHFKLRGFPDRMFRYKVILLDGRTNKDPKGTENGDFLGVQQWNWLENELSSGEVSSHDLVLLGTGIQFLSDDKLVEENWGEFPKQRKRLLDLVSKAAVQTNVLLISGDIHCAEINQVSCSLSSVDGSVKEKITLMEVTSSGLSHTFDKIMDFDRMKKEHVESSRIIVKSRSIIANFIFQFYQLVYPAVYRENKYLDYYAGLHFATLDITVAEPLASSSSRLTAAFNIVNHEGKSVLTKQVSLRNKEDFPLIGEPSGLVSECHPIQGDLSPFGFQMFKAQLAVFLLVFFVLPCLAILWFGFAAVYYIFVGKELKRRDEIERNYQLYKQRSSHQKKD